MKTKVDKQYLEQLCKRYGKARKPEKSTILDELTKTTGYERKYAINLLRGKYRHHQGRITRPRRSQYDHLDAYYLSRAAELLDWINSKRLAPQIGVALDSLASAGRLSINAERRNRLTHISPATVDRLLARHKLRPSVRGHSYTKPGVLLKHQIPIRTFADWDENRVGFFEIDLVGHDGGVARGEFGWTLNFVDVKSQWTEQVAVRNKAQVHVFAGIKRIRGRLPLPLLGIDSDSGGEFINNQLYRYCIQEKITFTRGRPGKKNDQPWVEQKNDSVVRHWVGYWRYDQPEQIAVLNELYEVLRIYTNFFLPVQKLAHKERSGSRVKRMYGRPKTPYQRILETSDVSASIKEQLMQTYASLNLVELKEQLDALCSRLKPTKLG